MRWTKLIEEDEINHISNAVVILQTCAIGDARFKSKADWYEHDELSYILFVWETNENEFCWSQILLMLIWE